MGPLCLLILTRTAAPAKFLFQPTKGFFNLLSVCVVGFDFTRCERQIVRPPVAAAARL